MILEKKENSTTSWLVQELNPVMIEPIELYFIQPLGGPFTWERKKHHFCENGVVILIEKVKEINIDKSWKKDH